MFLRRYFKDWHRVTYVEGVKRLCLNSPGNFPNVLAENSKDSKWLLYHFTQFFASLSDCLHRNNQTGSLGLVALTLLHGEAQVLLLKTIFFCFRIPSSHCMLRKSSDGTTGTQTVARILYFRACVPNVNVGLKASYRHPGGQALRTCKFCQSSIFLPCRKTSLMCSRQRKVHLRFLRHRKEITDLGQVRTRCHRFKGAYTLSKVLTWRIIGDVGTQPE